VYDYIVVCKRPNYKLIDGISQLMLLLSMISFASSVESPATGIKSVVLSSLIVGITGWLIYSYYTQRKGGIAFYRIGLIMGCIGWALQDGWQWMALVFFLASLLEKQVKFPVEIAFDNNEIVVNSLPKKYYYWNELSNAVIKDGILTLDMKTNKFIQKEIEDSGSAILEKDFNEFCRERIDAEKAGATVKV